MALDVKICTAMEADSNYFVVGAGTMEKMLEASRHMLEDLENGEIALTYRKSVYDAYSINVVQNGVEIRRK